MASVTDDFTLIKGIGPVIAARIRDTGIATFSQLAVLSTADITARIDGVSARRIIRERWTNQARKLARQGPTADQQPGRSAAESRQHYATFTVELLLDEYNSVRRTRVTQIQPEAEEAWAGWQDARLMDFFVRQAGLRVPQPEFISRPSPALQAQVADQLSSPGIVTSLNGVLRIRDLEILRPGSDELQNSVQAGEVFSVRVVLDLIEVKRAV